MRPNLRSVIAQVTRGGSSAVCRRNFTGSTGNGKLLSQGLSLAIGYGIARCVFGDFVSGMEENRQKTCRKNRGDSVEIVDLRETMWSDLRESLWSDLKEKLGSVGKF